MIFLKALRFTQMSSTNQVSESDVVNNVENVFINGPLSTNYVVSVIGRRVNVNAVHAHPEGVVQDFALVISSGDDIELEEPFKLEDLDPALPDFTPPVYAITNGYLDWRIVWAPMPRFWNDQRPDATMAILRLHQFLAIHQ